MTRGVVELIRALYEMRRANGITDAEARWVLEMVLPVYGVTLPALARWLSGQEPEAARGSA